MIQIENLSKTYKTSAGGFTALSDVNLTVNDGEIFGIIGLSGAGKSTLVRCINFLEVPTSGKVVIDGDEMGTLSKKELLIKRRSIGMIFQGFNLLEQRTVLKNICFPLEIAKVPKEQAVKRARELLELVGLADKESSYPSQLSGGQKQRVAIARALAAETKYLLCDEATSALDPDTTRSILDLLKKVNKELGVTIIVITHEMKVIESICDRAAVLDGGNVAFSPSRSKAVVTDRVFSENPARVGWGSPFPSPKRNKYTRDRPPSAPPSTAAPRETTLWRLSRSILLTGPTAGICS